MKAILRFWKIIVLDILGLACMVLAILTGWLPGPGGIPLFLIGLSLLAVNHEWAERYIDMLKKYADRLGDIIFANNKKLQIFYDFLGPVLLATAAYLAWLHNAYWQISLAISLTLLGITILLGNRQRFAKLKQRFKHKQSK